MILVAQEVAIGDLRPVGSNHSGVSDIIPRVLGARHEGVVHITVPAQAALCWDSHH